LIFHATVVANKDEYLPCVQLGGFRLPFISLGSTLLFVGFVSYFVLPSQNGKMSRAQREAFFPLFVAWLANSGHRLWLAKTAETFHGCL